MDEWKPIETAPLNEWVLLYGDPFGEGPKIAVGKAQVVTTEWWEQVSETRQELRSRSEVGWSDNAEVFATHWMPLPKPPHDPS